MAAGPVVAPDKHKYSAPEQMVLGENAPPNKPMNVNKSEVTFASFAWRTMPLVLMAVVLAVSIGETVDTKRGVLLIALEVILAMIAIKAMASIKSHH